jgi:2-polyprenyl-6-methoxyphenol hydroxylase-like FAD-dependent oxidoreductase
MSLHVIVGAGPVGAGAAGLLAGKGERVRLISRRGAGPRHPSIERVAADARQTGCQSWPRAPSPSTTAQTRSTTAGSRTGRPSRTPS